MAIKEFRLPDPGEGLVEADIVTWRVAVGDEIKVNDILVEIETSKSLVELPSPYAGTVTGLLVTEGDTVDVGRPIITIDDGTRGAGRGPGGARRWRRGRRRAGGQPGRLRREGGRHPATSAQGSGGEPAPVETHEQVNSTFAIDTPVSRRADQREPLQPAPAHPRADRCPPRGRRRRRRCRRRRAPCWPSRPSASSPGTWASTSAP